MFTIKDKYVTDQCRTPGRKTGSVNNPTGARLRSHWVTVQPISDGPLDPIQARAALETTVKGVIDNHDAGLAGYITCIDSTGQWPHTYTSAQLIASTDPVGLVLTYYLGGEEPPKHPAEKPTWFRHEVEDALRAAGFAPPAARGHLWIKYLEWASGSGHCKKALEVSYTRLPRIDDAGREQDTDGVIYVCFHETVWDRKYFRSQAELEAWIASIPSLATTQILR